MGESPVPRDPGQDGDLPGAPPGPGDRPWLGSPGWQLVPQIPDWDEAYLAAAAHEEDPGDPEEYEEYEDPDNCPPPGLDDRELAALIAAADEITADHARAEAIRSALGQTAAIAAVGALATGRRGPGMPGSADTYPGGHPSPAAGFGTGQPLDTARGCPTLGSFLEDAAGEDDRYTGATDDELAGVICAQDRVEAHASAVKHAAVAELIRRRPAPDAPVTGPAQLPEGWSEFTGRELGAILGISAGDAAEMLDLAWHLEGRLPGTRALFRTGVLSRDKAAAIAWATAFLTPEEARAAEALVLGRAARLTWAGLRAAIRAAVMDVNPGAARTRREHDAKRTRVERWAEDSGNAGLAGRELPPAEVLAADQRVTAWAQQLRTAGLDGTMDQLRARAYLDLLLGTDSRPHATSPDTTGTHGQDTSTTTSTTTSTSTGTSTGTSSQDTGAHSSDSTDNRNSSTRHPDGTDSQDTSAYGPDGTDTDEHGLSTAPPPGTGDSPQSDSGQDGPGGPGGPSPADPPGPRTPAPAGPVAGVIPPGFAARVNLTIPALTVLDLAHRPGQMTGIGPIDPGLARDLAAAAARNPRTTWCVTVTDSHGHAIGHGCARPAPASSRTKH